MEIDSSYTFQHVYVEAAMDASGNRIETGDKSDDAKSQTATMFTLVLSEKDCGLFAEMIANCGDNIRLGKLQYNTSQDYQVFLQRGNTNTGFIESSTNKESSSDSASESDTDKEAKAAAKKQKAAAKALDEQLKNDTATGTTAAQEKAQAKKDQEEAAKAKKEAEQAKKEAEQAKEEAAKEKAEAAKAKKEAEQSKTSGKDSKDSSKTNSVTVKKAQ